MTYVIECESQTRLKSTYVVECDGYIKEWESLTRLKLTYVVECDGYINRNIKRRKHGSGKSTGDPVVCDTM
jgi:hypothetical protein